MASLLLLEQNDYLPLPARPIERIRDGDHFTLFIIPNKKLYNGTIFLLSDLQQSWPDLLNGSFLGHIRADFSEEVHLITHFCFSSVH